MQEIRILPDEEQLADAAAHRFISAGNAAIEDRGTFMVALAGGSTPKSMYARLATKPFVSSIDWSRIHFFWGDERCVPPEHEASNYRMAQEALLAHVPVPETNVHRMRGEGEPLTVAVEYERVLRAVLRTPKGPPRHEPSFQLDLVLLGLGADGHTASLFPGSASLHTETVWVAAEYVDAVSMWRVTLTPVVISAAAEIVFLVSGAAKADIAARVIAEPAGRETLPAQLIATMSERVVWLLDAPAAAGLQRGSVRQGSIDVPGASVLAHGTDASLPGGYEIDDGQAKGLTMTDDEGSTPLDSTRRGYVVIDQADEIDVTSYDSFPASDPPSWTPTGIGPPHDSEPHPRDVQGQQAPSSGGRQDHEDLS